MDETTWLTCESPSQMMQMLREYGEPEPRSFCWHPVIGALPRKWRLFLAACCQRLLSPADKHLQTSEFKLISFVESVVEEQPTEEIRENIVSWFDVSLKHWITRRQLLSSLTSPLAEAAGQLRNAAVQHIRKSNTPRTSRVSKKQQGRDTEARAQCDLIRDIFCNPFRPVNFPLSWRTEHTVGLAAQMYESRNFTTMPFLADALEEAGCDNAEVLLHCRGDGPHVRGCWVVDLVLGKE